MTTNGIGNAWVANELHQLGKAGIPFRLHTMRSPGVTFHASQWADQLDRQTHVLYPVSKFKVAASVLAAPFLFGKRFFSAAANAVFGKRESLRVRLAGIAHLMVACHWARQLRHQEVSLIHSQWIHSGGTIAMYGGWLLDKPFSFTGHAADLFRERAALEDKVKRAARIVCISEFHREFYLKMGVPNEKLQVVYCGIDTSLFHPTPQRKTPVPHILSSGRLVEKKGFEYLIDACHLLDQQGREFCCTIGGSGPLEASLRERIQKLNLEHKITLTGEALKQEQVPTFMHSGDVYCLPCVWAKDNDVDGLPQMLMEAMACGLPAVSTRLVGIPDLLIQGETGLLVEPNNAKQLADALITLMDDSPLAEKIAKQGRAHVLSKFDLGTCLDPLIKMYGPYLERSEQQQTASSTPTIKTTVKS